MIRSVGLLLGGVLVAAATGLGFYQQQAGQTRLDQEVALLSQQLSEANVGVAQNADYTVKFMRYAVEKNRYQSHEVAALASAEDLRVRTTALLREIRALRRATGPADSVALLRPRAPLLIEQARQFDEPAFPALRQQLALYSAAIRRLHPTDSSSLVVPSLDDASPALAVASLAQAENALLAAETGTLKYLMQQIGRQEPRAKVVAVATPQSNRVAPGEVYRAHLVLVKSLSSPSIRMFYNGHPIPIDREGAGLVRFKAPAKAGPAEWHGAIRARLGGRDTTFRVRVPYRVVRR
ncbi:hypothetical protein [Hymenobacter ruricola]|uniref:Gliding motility-associated protein GldM first immunoglobulin-like domain-containing protein n=1 Tax=Hymenobacter ruricola TaxID=2791023 RepID=A0ABS0I0E1_9BACT|nr:hypothetical protein [Hymenobacter ruricola]MBF9220398.1 hypothetical protein [Hymenobacter ruricola]